MIPIRVVKIRTAVAWYRLFSESRTGFVDVPALYEYEAMASWDLPVTWRAGIVVPRVRFYRMAVAVVSDPTRMAGCLNDS